MRGRRPTSQSHLPATRRESSCCRLPISRTIRRWTPATTPLLGSWDGCSPSPTSCSTRSAQCSTATDLRDSTGRRKALPRWACAVSPSNTASPANVVCDRLRHIGGKPHATSIRGRRTSHVAHVQPPSAVGPRHPFKGPLACQSPCLNHYTCGCHKVWRGGTPGAAHRVVDLYAFFHIGRGVGGASLKRHQKRSVHASFRSANTPHDFSRFLRYLPAMPRRAPDASAVPVAVVPQRAPVSTRRPPSHR